MLYHWITAVIGIALFLWLSAWLQARATYKESEGVTEEALCIKGTHCQSCTWGAHAKIDSRKDIAVKDCFEPSDEIGSQSRMASREVTTDLW